MSTLLLKPISLSAVKTWDGGQNTIDSSILEGEGRKRARSQWDEELDRGKVGVPVQNQ